MAMTPERSRVRRQVARVQSIRGRPLSDTNSAFGLFRLGRLQGLFRLGRLQGLVRLAGFFDTTGLTALSVPVMGTIHPAAGQL